MPKQVKVGLGSREYVIAEKYSGITEAWRKHLRESSVYTTFQKLDGVVELIMQIAENGMDGEGFEKVTTLAHILPAVVTSLATSMDEVKALIFDYSPEIAADKEWIGENVYDSELVMAFIEVLKLNFPILGVLELIRGLKAPGTSTNLPSVNGGSGTKKSLAPKRTR